MNKQFLRFTFFLLICLTLPLTAAAQVVNIPDPNLRTAIEKALGKASGATITVSDMANLTRLEAKNANISDLTGLEFATNLTNLDLSDEYVEAERRWINSNSVSDLSPISGLTKLRGLWLQRNAVSDISPVAGLTNLTRLGLRENTISDISPLAGLTNLTWLNLAFTSISDISPLAGLTNLTDLLLFGNSILDISPLAGLTNLATLTLTRNGLSDISPLASLTNLTRLGLAQNNLSDISALAGLTNLATLGLAYNDISDISSLVGLTNLTRLGLRHNRLSDISPLAGLTNLTRLDLRHNHLSNISALVANTGLGSGDEFLVDSNPLSYSAINTHIPDLLSRGVTVEFDDRTPTTLLLISGVITELNNLLIVEVRDSNNFVFAGVPVTFTVTSGGGTLSTTHTTTDENGRAESRLTLGSGGGTNVVRASVEGISESITFSNVEAAIPDPNLRTAIENALGKTPGSPIAPAEMAALTHLEARNANISDLTGLESAANLKHLYLPQNSISNISPLSGLTNLTGLWLERNAFTDISPLAGLTNLTELNLGGNNLSNISPVAGLTNLRQLWLWDNNISDISPVAGLTNLIELILQSNAISDISPVAGLTNLTGLWLAYNTISDISPLVANTGLGSGDRVFVNDNPLSFVSIKAHIPALKNRGVTVEFDNRTPTTLQKTLSVITELDSLLIVEVRDSKGLVFEGVPVTFTITSGGGTLSAIRTMTDENGRAESRFTLGSDRGTSTVRVSVEGISEPAIFTPSVNTNGMVRLVYFLPSDRPRRPDRIEALRQLVKDAQQFFAAEMHRHGFGRKTFTLETDAAGEPLIHEVNGKFTEGYYYSHSTDFKVWEELLEHFDNFQHVYFVAIDLNNETLYGGKSCGVGAVSFLSSNRGLWLRNRENPKGQSIGGCAVIPASGACFEKLGLTAHELGHAFGLAHDFREGRNGNYVMAYGPQTRLSKCAAEWLSASRFFNTKSLFRNEPGEIQILELQSHSQDAISLRFKATDPDGLHHAQLVLPEGSLGPILFDCQQLNGKTSTVEFAISTAELVHRITLKVIDAGRITLQFIDLSGNITWTRFPIQLDDVPQPTILKVSGDNQKGVSFAPLSHPFIVEVRDPNGSALAGVSVTFAVVAGGGTLSTTSTTTDENGRAQSTLTLGPNLGTNTISVSATGIEGLVSFHATSDYLPTEYLLAIPAGISLIHIPLKVTTVDGVPKTITSVADLYDVLGGADNVNLLITHDSTTQRWHSYLGNINRGTVVDPVLTGDKGIIAVMHNAVSLRLGGDALGTNGSSSITLHPGTNLVGLPLRDSRIARMTDLFALEGVGGNVSVVIFSDNGTFQTVGQSGAVIVLDSGAFQTVGQVGDASDIPITGGQSFLLNAREAATVVFSGDPYYNFSEMITTVPLPTTTGIEVEDTTPALALKGSIVNQETHVNREGFSVTVKNLSTDKVTTTIIGDENQFSPDKWESKKVEYQLTVVDAQTGRAAMIGDILEISVQSLDPLIRVQPLQYIVTADDVKQSRIQLPELVIYKILWETSLLQNYPNPFTPETWIPYRLAEDAFVTLTIYDQTGHLVRTLNVGNRIAAVYESESKAIYWDGRNGLGERVASGVYFYTLTAGDYSATRRMLILK